MTNGRPIYVCIICMLVDVHRCQVSHTHTHTRTRTHTYIHTQAHMCTHTYTHKHIHTYTSTHVRTHIYTHTHTHTETHTHACARAHTHTPIWNFGLLFWHLPLLKLDFINGWPLKAIFCILRKAADFIKYYNEVSKKISALTCKGYPACYWHC